MRPKLAIEGGRPVRDRQLPYGKQDVDAADIEAVIAALRSDWLTTGPRVDEFEQAFAQFTGARHAVAVSNGTAALHAAMFALGIGSGDEVIVPTLTFAASSNAVVYQGGTPVFADVDARSLLIDPASVARLITPRTRAIVAVDYAGQPCDYDALAEIAAAQNISIVADAAHSVGATDNGRNVGTLAALSTFSFHPVKQMTTGEGGMITTDSDEFAQRMRIFRNHGITTDHRQRSERGGFSYEMVDLGYNYRITDIQSALGIRQLQKLPGYLERRRIIARAYDSAFASLDTLRVPLQRSGVVHSYHLYVVLLELEKLSASRDEIYAALRAEGIGVNVHYPLVHLHPYYRTRFGTGAGLCPVAERAYAQLLTLPLFPTMTDADMNDVVTAVGKVTERYLR